MRKNGRGRRKVILMRMVSKVKRCRGREISKRGKRVTSNNTRARMDSTSKMKRGRCPWTKNKTNNQ